MRTLTATSIILVCATFAISLCADPSNYVDRAAVEGLADKLSRRLLEFVCDQLRAGPLSSGQPCNTKGLKQLFESLNIQGAHEYTPEDFLVQQILPEVQAVLNPVRR
jgi:hypothetical protein